MMVLEGEILPPEKGLTDHAVRAASHDVSFYPATFEGQRQEFTIIPGLTIGQIVSLAIPDRAMWPGVTVWLLSDHGRVELSPHYWGQIKPRPGVRIEISYTPMGDDGGKILRGVLMIVIAVAAFYTGGLAASALGLAKGSLAAGLVAGLVAGAIGALGMMALNALVPIKAPVSEVQKTPTSSTGFSNRLAFGEPIPVVHGKLRIYPNMAAQNYFESVGDNRYQRALFLIGRGPCELSDFRIGNQSLDEFEDVELEIMQGWDDDPVPTLYQREVSEESFGTLLNPNVDQTFQTPLDTIECHLDFLFGTGLISYDSKGRRQSRSVSVNIEYRKVGDVPWLALPFVYEAGGFGGRLRFPFYGYSGYGGYGGYYGDYGAPVGGAGGVSQSFSAKSDTPIIRPKKITFPEPGQYEFRLRRTTAAAGDQTRDEVQLAVLRSFKNNPPVTVDGLCLVALRIRLTGQKSTQINNFNCVVQKLTAYHNGGAWVEPAVTRDASGDMTPHRSRSPAAAYCDVFRGSGVRRVMADNRLDMTSISEWWAYCDSIDARTGAARYTYDAVILGRTTVREMIKEICTVGRARFVAPNGQYGVMRDKVQTVPVNMFTARNSKNLSGSFNLGMPVHGIKIKFANEAKDGQEETYTVYADGYDETTATEFEEITMRGLVNTARCHEFGRYLLGVMKLRPETITLTTYIDALHNQTGDYIVINHDVPRHGLSSGRIVSLTTDIDSNITSITVDEVASMDAGQNYAVSIRRPKNANMIVSAAINTVPGDQQLLTFTAPIVPSMAPAVGDLVSFGVATKVTRDVILTGMRHLGKDYIFELTCVDLANAIHDVAAETFPPFDNSSTPDPEVTPPGPLTNLVLTENIIYPSGVARSEVWATWTAPVGIPIAQFEIYEDFNGEFTLLGISLDNRYRLPGQMSAGEDITVRAVAVSLAGNKLPVRLAPSATILLDGIADAIAPLTGLAVTALPEALKINWNASAALAAKGTHLYRSATDVQPANPYKSFAIPIDEFRDDIGAVGQTYFYWVRPYDQDDIIGPWNGAAGVSAETGAVDYSSVANGPPAGATVGAPPGTNVGNILSNYIERESYDPGMGLGVYGVTAVAAGQYPAAYISANVSHILGVGSQGGDVVQCDGQRGLFAVKAYPVDITKSYKVKFRVRQTVDDSGKSGIYAGVACLDANYAHIADGGAGTYRYCAVSGVQITVASGWLTYEGIMSGVGSSANNFRSGTVFVRPMCIVNYQAGTGSAQVDWLSLEEIIDYVEYGADVTADNTSAATATVGGVAAATIAADAAKAAAGLDASGLVKKTVPTLYIPSITIDKLLSGDLGAVIELTGASRINYRVGGYIKKTGVGFGSSNQFIEWFGPDIAENLMTESNSISHLTTDGSQKLTGTLIVGVLSTTAQTPDLSATASVETGNFGSNGNPIIINASYTLSGTQIIGFTAPPAITDTTISWNNVDLYIDEWTGAAWVQRATLPIPGSRRTQTFDDAEFGTGTRTDWNFSGSISYTDTAGGTANRLYRARIAGGDAAAITAPVQRLSIVTSEN